MGAKRKQSESSTLDDHDEGDGERRGSSRDKRNKPTMEKKEELRPSMIKNKQKRSALHSKLKQQKKLEKRKTKKARQAADKQAVELGEEPPARQVPHTIENKRVPDETVCKPDDAELFVANDADEFSTILRQERTPKVLITTCRFHSTRGPAFIEELLSVIPNAHYYKRGTYDLKKIIEYGIKQDFTSVVVVHTNRREPDALLISSLPSGPTAHFKLSKLVLRKDIKNHGNPTGHIPELVLNNFTTRLGHRVGRMIQSLFPQNPNFRGRRVVTFHNQRDFIFFRHHRCASDNAITFLYIQVIILYPHTRTLTYCELRYIFEEKENKQKDSKSTKGKDAKDSKVAKGQTIVRLQECGPRFTLKLKTLQHGIFDTQGGEYEWIHKVRFFSSYRSGLGCRKWTPAGEGSSSEFILGHSSFPLFGDAPPNFCRDYFVTLNGLIVPISYYRQSTA
ncbi:Ribosome production factor 1 [Linum grandiflorum]